MPGLVGIPIEAVYLVPTQRNGGEILDLDVAGYSKIADQPPYLEDLRGSGVDA